MSTLKAVNLYIILKGLVFLIRVHKIRNLQTHTKCSHFRFIYKQWVPLKPRKLKFPSLESMLFKQSLIWTNVWESGSYPHFRSSQKGWGGIRNLNKFLQDSEGRVWQRGRGCVCTVPVQPSVLLSTTHSPVLPRQLQEPHAGQWRRIHPLRRCCLFQRLAVTQGVKLKSFFCLWVPGSTPDSCW